jgi:hypothetical protein
MKIGTESPDRAQRAADDRTRLVIPDAASIRPRTDIRSPPGDGGAKRRSNADLPNSSIAVIGVPGIVCCLRGPWRFDASREVGLALFHEGRERLSCVFGTYLRTELFVFSLHRSLDLLTKWLLHQPLAGLQR